MSSDGGSLRSARGERWILDTAYSSWLAAVLDRVQLIVALDYPRWRSLVRLVWRTLLRNLDHRPICNGNTESFRQTFSRDSIIVWYFKTFARKRARMRAWAADPSGPEVVRLTSPAVAPTLHLVACLRRCIRYPPSAESARPAPKYRALPIASRAATAPARSATGLRRA